MKLASFIRDNARWLGAGVLMTSSSSFGQTYFIALSAAHLQATFSLSHGDWGTLYTAGTLLSAIVLTQVGPLADRFKVRTLAIITIAAFALCCLAMSAVSHWLMLVFVIFGLRLCGQGMMSHLALTAMGRWFRGNRGRAVAVASLGFSLGEGLLPLTFVLLTGAIGWRGGWIVAAFTLVLVVAPVLLLLLRFERSPQSMSEAHHSVGLAGRHWTRRDAMRHWLFWAMTPGLLAPSFMTTALFFHQVHLVEVKGWPLASYVATYPLYSTMVFVANFFAGSIADRFGAARLLPVYLLPMGAGLSVMALADTFWLGPAALILCAMTQGASQAMIGSIWPEYFGTRHLGAIRAFAVAATVFSTAAGPGVTGLLIDAGLPFETQCLWMSVYVVLISLVFIAVAHAAHRERYGGGDQIGAD